MAEVPFPQPPNFQAFQPNPLQQMGQMQHMMLQAQALEKAQQEQAAKNALGQIMAEHINKETGEVDLKKVLVDVAKHPDGQALFGDIYKDVLATGKAQQEEVMAALGVEQRKMETAANLAATYHPRAADGKEPRGQILSSFAADAVARGIMTREEAAKLVQEGMSSPRPLTAMFGGLQQASSLGQSALENSFATARQHNELVDFVGPDGTPRKAPRYMVDAMMGQPNAAAGGQAPSPTQIGGGGNPSQPASPGIRTGTSDSQKQMQEQQLKQFGDFETDTREMAKQADNLEMRMNEAVALSKQFKTGPGQEMMYKMAGIAKFIGRDDIAERFMQGSEQIGKMKNSYDAAQAFQKLIVTNSLELLRQTLGGQGRITNMEVQQFAAANMNIETTPEAIRKIAEFTRRMGDIYRNQAVAIQHYKQHTTKTGKLPDALEFDNAWRKRAKERGWLNNMEGID